MEVEKSKCREERADKEASPARENRDGRRKEKDHRSKDKEKDYDREKKRDKKHPRDKEKEKDRKRDKDGDIEKEISRGRAKERKKDKSRDQARDREREKEKSKDKDRSRVKERASKKSHEDDDDTEKAAERNDHYDNRGPNEDGDYVNAASSGKEASASELEDGILKMREERKKKVEEASDALSWVARSRKIEEITPDETIHEVAVGRGLSGALKLLKDRGTLKEKVEWGGRNKSKLVGIVDDEGGKERFKDIRIERTDEFGRTLTQKEAFRLHSHKFHGKGPGKMKEEKRMKQYQEELKLKQIDTPSLFVQRMREAQAQLKTPYLVLSGNVRPGHPATVEKDVPGSLTPMLNDKKRKSEPGNSDTPSKRPKH